MRYYSGPRRRPRGFSARPVKPVWDMMLGAGGVRGRRKRELFNGLSARIAGAAGFVTFVVTTVRVSESVGLLAGAVLGLAAGCVAFAVAAHVLVKGRYFRP